MLTKLIIFGLLCSTVLQASPTTKEESEEDEQCILPKSKSSSKAEIDPKAESKSKAEPDSKHESDSKPESGSKTESKKEEPNSANDTIPCADQIEWVKNTTLETKSQYEEYYKKFTENNVDATSLSPVKEEHEHIEKVIADSLKKYDIDLKKVRDNVQDQWNICRDELKSFSVMNRNLSAMAQTLRPKVLDLAKRLGLSPSAVDDLDHTLGRIVNFIFIIDMGKNTFRDIYSMVKEAGVKTVDGIKLEDKYKFTEEGVEAIGELAENEKIGHIEEPAKIEFITLDNERVSKEPTYTLDDSDMDKDLEQLLDNRELGNTERELKERERQVELAKEQLSEQRKEEEHQMKEEQEIEEKEALERARKSPLVLHVT